MNFNKKLLFFSAGIIASSAIVVPAVDAATYVVQTGDTLTKIAKEHNTTIEQLKKWNSLKSDGILVGQTLTVSTSAEVKKELAVQKNNAKLPSQNQVASFTNTEFSLYTVVTGDTLTKIAKEQNVSLDQLKQWNSLKSDEIFVGQILTVSKSTVAKKETAVQKYNTNLLSSNQVATFTDSANTLYTVVTGDTLIKIANYYNVTIEQLKKWNNLQSNVIYVGQTLTISPDSTSSTVVSASQKR